MLSLTKFGGTETDTANFALIQEIMRWDMGVLRESPWYQEILREGEARGEIQGLITGIEMNLDAKFGREGLELMPKIRNINDIEELKGILQTVITANTIDDLRQSYS